MSLIRNSICILQFHPGRNLPEEVTFRSVEEMREKFLNLSFTESELAIIKRCMVDCESFAVIDPRLLFCIRLPEGASLRKGKIEFSAEHFNGFSNGFSEHYALIDFGTIDPPDECDDYTKMIAEIKAYPAFGSQYKRRMEEGWTDDSGGFSTHYYETLKETVYKGRPALYMENKYGVCYRYTVKEGNRIYYVMETFGNETDLTCGSICVQTFYDDYLCYYRYYSPSQDCIDNIFSSYNIFDFEEIVE